MRKGLTEHHRVFFLEHAEVGILLKQNKPLCSLLN